MSNYETIRKLVKAASSQVHLQHILECAVASGMLTDGQASILAESHTAESSPVVPKAQLSAAESVFNAASGMSRALLQGNLVDVFDWSITLHMKSAELLSMLVGELRQRD